MIEGALPIPVTNIDKVAGIITDENRQELGLKNARLAVTTFAGITPIPESTLNLIANVLAHRRELNRTPLTEAGAYKSISRVLEKIHSARASRKPNQPLSANERSVHLSELQSIAKAKGNLAEPKPTNVPIDHLLGLRVEFCAAQWEGLYGVFFSALERGLSYPLYAVRLNTRLTEGKITAAIRSIQGWTSEEITSVKGIHARYHGLNRYDENALQAMDAIVRERNRCLDILMRRINAGRNIYDERARMQPPELFLLLSLAYLQKYGIKLFEGLKHELHPSVLADHGKEFNFNLDTLFGKYFYPTSDPMYKWKLDAENSICYIPHGNRLSYTFRSLAEALFYA